MKSILTGLVPALSNEEYQSRTSYLSSSGLTELRRSGAHYQAYVKGPRKSSPAKEFGSGFHEMIGEPELFAKRYAKGPSKEDFPNALFTIDDIKQRLAAIDSPELKKIPSKAAKPELIRTLLAVDPKAVIWDDVIAKHAKDNAGKLVLSAEEFEKLDGMFASIISNRVVLNLLRGGVAEQSIFWKDTGTGVYCKCRPDYLRPDFITPDWKTTEDASESGFKKAVKTYRYDLKTAHYLRGISDIAGEPVTEFIHIMIEKKPPYAIGLYALSDSTLKSADSEVGDLFSRFAEYSKKNEWPSYSTDVQDVDMAWLY